MTSFPDSLRFGPRFDVAVRSAAGAQAGCSLENQDNFLLIDTAGMASFLEGQVERRQRVQGWPPGHIRLAVLDGMGGHGRGREAAEAVVAGLLAVPACASLGELAVHLDALHASLQHYFSIDSIPGKRPGTTLTMLELRPGQPALLYHVGDSRLYQLARGQATPLTIDHVPATAYAMEGLMTQSQWWQQVHGEHRSQISQAFILGNAFANPAELSDPLYALTPLNLPSFLCHLPDRRALELDADATYVLATDGFWACRTPQAWVQRWPALFNGIGIGSAAAIVDRLFDEMAGQPPSGLHPDNITAIVLRAVRHDETALPAARACETPAPDEIA
jgi:serine/threonine protein phosphatase PrpC